VTAGGTREPIDSVRYIGNRSSGRMGLALAAVAARRGASVTLIAANVALVTPSGVRAVPVATAAELADRCTAEFDGCDVLLMAAAVADFRPAAPLAHKHKKQLGAPLVTLEPTEDVIGTLAERRRPGQLVIGFAAEHGDDAVADAAAKLERKGIDAIVVNDISQPGIGFDSNENQVTILTRDGRRVDVPRAHKELVAGVVLGEVERLLVEGGEQDGTVGRVAGSALGH